MGYLRVLVIMHADMSIKVCHVTSGHGSTDGRIFQKELKSLSKRYEVMEIAPNVEDMEVDGIKIYGVPVPKSKIKKIFGLNPIFEKAKELDADIYHLHEPELIPIALKLKKYGKKIVFDSHEDTPMQILGMLWLPKWLRKPISKVYTLYEKNNVGKFDAVLSVTPSIVERLKKHNPHTWQVTNYPIYEEIPDGRKWGRSVSFAGGISSQWMHTEVIEALAMTEAKYLLAGRVNSETYLDGLKRQKGWGRVDFRGLLKFKDVNSMLQESSAGIALNDYVANVGYKMGSLGNTKLFEYMMAGIPVIATDFTLWKKIVEECDCGVCINPHDVDAIAKAITLFTENTELAKEKGDNGRKAVKEKYCWATQEPILFEMYDYVTSK